MEQKQQPRPMTPEELEDEAAYAEKAFADYTNNSNPEMVREAFTRHRQPKAAGLITNAIAQDSKT